MYIETGTLVRLVCDIQDWEGVVIASAGMTFEWDADYVDQVVNGVICLVEDDDVEVV